MNIEISRAEVKALAEILTYAKICHIGECSDKWDKIGHALDGAQIAIEDALQRPVYLNVYAVTRHYGGPEEGGWWYNAGELIESIETTEEKCEEVRTTLEIKHKDVNQGDIYSVLGGTLLEIHIDEYPGESWPAKTPHYE